MYTQNDLTRANGRCRRETAAALALLAAGIALAAAALIVRNRLLGTAGLALFAALAYARLALWTLPWYRYRYFLRDLLGGLTRDNEGWFSGIEEAPRLSEEGVMVRGVTVSESPGGAQPLMYYWDARYPFPEVEPGRKLFLTTYGRYIRDIRVGES